MPNFAPMACPATQHRNVTHAMNDAAVVMRMSSAARLTPTASASMLVATACVRMTPIVTAVGQLSSSEFHSRTASTSILPPM